MKNSNNKEKARSLYTEGLSFQDIATSLGVSRQMVHVYKKEDAKKGILWDVLRLSQERNQKSLDEKEAIFLNALFRSFDVYIKGLEEGTLSLEVLEKLNHYAKTYYALKAPKKIDTKTLKLETASKIIKALGELAVQESNQEVSLFLSRKSDEIISLILENHTPV